MDLESQLLKHYGGTSAVPWNGSGFGSNDPGRNRDKTVSSSEAFDVQFPIDIDRPLEIDRPTQASAAETLTNLKSALPYLLRFQNRPGTRSPHAELENTIVDLSTARPTARGLISTVTKSLPPGWQATKLSGRVILYKETENYPSSEVIADSNH